jgi:hypothetical protein
MILEEHVARMGEKRFAKVLFFENLKEKRKKIR